MVASIREQEFRPAIRLLERWGPVNRTDYYNVVVLRAEQTARLLEELREQVEAEPGTLNLLGRVIPATGTFDFQNRPEFEEKARELGVAWAPRLAGMSFHVRMHRRGFKRQLSSLEQEQILAGAILEELERLVSPAKITFEDPDAVLDIETVGGRAGLSLWTREERQRYPFLGLE